MKRSEMIKLITELTLSIDTEFKLNALEAELLLSKLEEVGMKPPTYTERIPATFRDLSGDVKVMGLIRSEAEGWEPED